MPITTYEELMAFTRPIRDKLLRMSHDRPRKPEPHFRSALVLRQRKARPRYPRQYPQ